MSKKAIAGKELKHLKDILFRCIFCMKAQKSVASIDVTHGISTVVLEYKDRDITITLTSKMAVGASDTECLLQVVYEQISVLEVTGAFFAVPQNITLQVYIPGDWEEKIPKPPN